MKGFWMVLVLLAAGFATGCPDGDDTCTECSCDPSLCDGGADADADVDGDTAVERCTELLVESTPAGAAVALQGEPAFSCAATPCVLTNVPVGLHTFLLTLDGYDAAPAEVTITTECIPVNITLYPSVEGDWDLTFHNPSTTDEFTVWHLSQTEMTITGTEDLYGCEYTGVITADGDVAFAWSGCGAITGTLDGSRVNENRMEGTWESTGGGAGTWWADRR